MLLETVLTLALVLTLSAPAVAAAPADTPGTAPKATPMPKEDTIETSAGPLTLRFIGHGSLAFAFAGKTLYVDPYGKAGDYAAMPKADLVLITHEHSDHLDPAALSAVAGPNTPLIVSEVVREKLGRGTALKNGEQIEVLGIPIAAVPAYNIKHHRDTGEPFHPQGRGNGYVLTFGDVRVYVAGDTEDIPEMAALAGVDVAFVPMNLPYTMTPEMAAAAARSLRPKKALYPYHYGDTDPARLVELLAGSGIEVRVRDLR
ncbi:MAG: putative Zn-dependent hydrolase [Solidesulfovibrio magneticus str. Maddingley MBC34]|uniref:Putative Zn-dependent hydrolase n=1 Tax=Solidesulfovibrio magneticus str. Maddingley MBC34 TaxID=1206767 RepID=K6HA75_9BACT|nr:MAG: putative Zn-dependent hydrolase [Solidesulfovibrio magneticus str. Maddingley MBC34]